MNDLTEKQHTETYDFFYYESGHELTMKQQEQLVIATKHKDLAVLFAQNCSYQHKL